MKNFSNCQGFALFYLIHDRMPGGSGGVGLSQTDWLTVQPLAPPAAVFFPVCRASGFFPCLDGIAVSMFSSATVCFLKAAGHLLLTVYRVQEFTAYYRPLAFSIFFMHAMHICMYSERFPALSF